MSVQYSHKWIKKWRYDWISFEHYWNYTGLHSNLKISLQRWSSVEGASHFKAALIWLCCLWSWRLAITERKINSQLYQGILRDNVTVVVRRLKTGRNRVMQQVNDPKQRSKSTTAHLQKRENPHFGVAQTLTQQRCFGLSSERCSQHLTLRLRLSWSGSGRELSNTPPGSCAGLTIVYLT